MRDSTQDSTGVVARTVADVLDVLASRLGSTAEHLWAVLVRQAVVGAWVAGIIAVLGLAGIIGGGVVLRHGLTRGGTEGDQYVPPGIILLVLGTIALVGGGLGAIGRFINPEFYALQFVLGQLRF